MLIKPTYRAIHQPIPESSVIYEIRLGLFDIDILESLLFFEYEVEEFCITYNPSPEAEIIDLTLPYIVHFISCLAWEPVHQVNDFLSEFRYNFRAWYELLFVYKEDDIHAKTHFMNQISNVPLDLTSEAFQWLQQRWVEEWEEEKDDAWT